jgi:hypothetical protein
MAARAQHSDEPTVGRNVHEMGEIENAMGRPQRWHTFPAVWSMSSRRFRQLAS